MRGKPSPFSATWSGQKRPLHELFNARFTFHNEALARHYQVPIPKDLPSDELQKIQLTADSRRGGLLTQGSVLSIGGDEASMVARGLFMLHEVLRGVIQDPPPCVDVTPVPTGSGLSQRDIATKRIENKSCGGCHGKFEPLAFAMEPFDGLGRFQRQDRHGNRLREDGLVHVPGDTAQQPYETSLELIVSLLTPRAQATLTWKVVPVAIGRPSWLRMEAVEAILSIHGAGWQLGLPHEGSVTHPWFTTIQTRNPYDPTFHQPTRRPQGRHHQHRPTLLEEWSFPTLSASPHPSTGDIPVRSFNLFFGLGIPAPLQEEGFDGVLEPLKPLKDKLLIMRHVDQVRCDQSGINAHFDGASGAMPPLLLWERPKREEPPLISSFDVIITPGATCRSAGTVVADTFFRRSRVSRYVQLSARRHGSSHHDGTAKDLFDRIFGRWALAAIRTPTNTSQKKCARFGGRAVQVHGRPIPTGRFFPLQGSRSSGTHP